MMKYTHEVRHLHNVYAGLDLGVPGVFAPKKERLLSDENVRKIGDIIGCRHSRLKEMQDTCKYLNEMFGLDISCKFREGLS